MKKQLLLPALLLLMSFAAKSQISDTKWRNSMNVPDPVDCILHFKKDTLIVMVAADPTNIVETMSYTIKNDTLTIVKLSGTSPCQETAGFYKCQLKEGKLYISPLNDDCYQRANAFTPEPWIKEK